MTTTVARRNVSDILDSWTPRMYFRKTGLIPNEGRREDKGTKVLNIDEHRTVKLHLEYVYSDVTPFNKRGNYRCALMTVTLFVDGKRCNTPFTLDTFLSAEDYRDITTSKDRVANVEVAAIKDAYASVDFEREALPRLLDGFESHWKGGGGAWHCGVLDRIGDFVGYYEVPVHETYRAKQLFAMKRLEIRRHGGMTEEQWQLLGKRLHYLFMPTPELAAEIKQLDPDGQLLIKVVRPGTMSGTMGQRLDAQLHQTSKAGPDLTLSRAMRRKIVATCAMALASTPATLRELVAYVQGTGRFTSVPDLYKFVSEQVAKYPMVFTYIENTDNYCLTSEALEFVYAPKTSASDLVGSS